MRLMKGIVIILLGTMIFTGCSNKNLDSDTIQTQENIDLEEESLDLGVTKDKIASELLEKKIKISSKETWFIHEGEVQSLEVLNREKDMTIGMEDVKAKLTIGNDFASITGTIELKFQYYEVDGLGWKLSEYSQLENIKIDEVLEVPDKESIEKDLIGKEFTYKIDPTERNQKIITKDDKLTIVEKTPVQDKYKVLVKVEFNEGEQIVRGDIKLIYKLVDEKHWILDVFLPLEYFEKETR